MKNEYSKGGKSQGSDKSAPIPTSGKGSGGAAGAGQPMGKGKASGATPKQTEKKVNLFKGGPS